MFTKPKHFKFLDPKIDLTVQEQENKYIITLSSQMFAKYVELDLVEDDCKFSDNYFDLSAGEQREIEVKKETLSKKASY
ncbi:glycoside hydrolase family 2 protein [Aquibacillus albus]|uniref:Beta-mannosidase Ig-fold domain-containing protein n=1 Tax=Aquibacillus albus TaxID=1168171 RepID=A0ABS2MXN4_9BACI|nr:glycoside hydrolase family 2 protein [Aquibacillus albus]MBM7570642.1 hypothetical protein [Aquibacillus albus]